MEFQPNLEQNHTYYLMIPLQKENVCTYLKKYRVWPTKIGHNSDKKKVSINISCPDVINKKISPEIPYFNLKDSLTHNK